ncbi:acyloxyacyl hydrolase [Chitinophaga flava]|nr:acyloxyacyl hydrolase [Chitinophaga flava]
MKASIITMALSLLAIGLQAQDSTDLWTKAKANPNLGRHKFIELKLHTGGHIYNGEDMASVLEHGYQALEVRMAWMSTGKQVWQRALNYPSYGIGFYTGNIGNSTILGNPSGIYGFFYAPFHRRKRHHFEAGLALGLTYDLNTYNPETNPLNNAISSKLDVYFNASATGVLRLSELFDFVYGVDLTHFSNGRTHTPNLGLNMAGVHAGLRVHYNTIRNIVVQQIDPNYEAPIRPTLLRDPLPKVKHTNELSIYGAFGVVQIDNSSGVDAYYGTASLVLDWNHKYTHVCSFGAGLDGFYDGSLGWGYARQYGKVTSLDKMLMGAHIGHAVHLQRFDLVTQVGTYLWRRDGTKGDWFLRLGIRYNINKYGFVQVGLKTQNGAAADWIEWGGGGRLEL